jgi:hypothetical protein
MPRTPDWTDKWLTKVTLGTWTRVPGNETARDDDALRDRPVRPLARWARRHGLALFFVLMFVLPGTLFWLTGDMPRLQRVLITFVPSIVIAAVLSRS